MSLLEPIRSCGVDVKTPSDMFLFYELFAEQLNQVWTKLAFRVAESRYMRVPRPAKSN